MFFFSWCHFVMHLNLIYFTMIVVGTFADSENRDSVGGSKWQFYCVILLLWLSKQIHVFRMLHSGIVNFKHFQPHYFSFVLCITNWWFAPFASYLITTTVLQCVWSLTVAIVDIYALLVKRCLRNRRAVTLFSIGDGVRKILFLFFMVLLKIF